jgi:hypothetical protein
MKKTFLIGGIIVLALVVMVLAFGIYKFNFTNDDIYLENGQKIDEQTVSNDANDLTGGVTIANPASVNCEKVGGKLMIQKRGDGGEYGLCYFEDNRACEEWALLRGDCPYGGRRTTGFDTIDQNYCAWLGGETFAVENSICTFKDGSKCPTIELYNGTCTPKLDL